VQKRTGKDNKTFHCIKFRTMKLNKEADTQQAITNDLRITRLGKILRLTHIDELPQLLNVLMGTMSIVGPRPHMLYHTEVYSKAYTYYLLRHESKPGMTGMAQIKGYLGEIITPRDLKKRVLWDIYYNKNASIRLDIYIAFTTLQQITGLSSSSISSLTLNFTTGKSSISVLSSGTKPLLATKRDKQGISLSMSTDFWELSPNLRKWSLENIEGESIDPKVKSLFSEQWLNIGYLPEPSIHSDDFINTQKGVEFTTNLATLEHLSNIDIIIHFLATITKSNIAYDPKTVFILKSKITNSKLDFVALSLAPLGFGNIDLIVKPEKNVKEIWQLRPVRIISQDYSQTNLISKSVDSALASILNNAEDIAIIKRTTLSPEILLQSYNEIAKDSDKSYTLSQSGGVMLSTKNQCRELIILDGKPLFTDC